MDIGYKLLARDFASRTQTHERLYYDPYGEWVTGRIYIAKSPWGAGLERHLHGSHDGWWLAEVEYHLDVEETRKLHFNLKVQADGVVIASAVRVRDCVEYTPRHIDLAARPSRRRGALRTLLRESAGLAPTDNFAQIDVVPGDSSPDIVGERGGHYTRGGTPIRHPSAYGRSGWSNMVYRCSTLQVTVGAQWLTRRGICPVMVA